MLYLEVVHEGLGLNLGLHGGLVKKIRGEGFCFTTGVGTTAERG